MRCPPAHLSLVHPWNAEKIIKASDSWTRFPEAEWRESHSHFPLFKSVLTVSSSLFQAVQGEEKDWALPSLWNTVPGSGVLSRVLRRRGAQRFPQPHSQVPTELGGDHQQALGTHKASSGLRAHSFPPGAPPRPLPSPLPAPFRKMFYELCA